MLCHERGNLFASLYKLNDHMGNLEHLVIVLQGRVRNTQELVLKLVAKVLLRQGFQ